MSNDLNHIYKEFPILSRKVYGKDLVYLDNGATTQKPQVVIDSINEYYKQTNSNVHRGVHYLSQEATQQMEDARAKVAQFINASDSSEVIFTKGTTDAINLVAFSYGETYIKEGDEVIITEMEHHSNIVPWQMMCNRKQAKLKYIPLLSDGTLEVNKLEELISNRTKILAITWVSNTLGTINPIEEIIKVCHQHDIHVLVDAAQGVQHLATDVQAMDVDFLVASGHKMYAATGIGFLYGRKELLNAMVPYQGGGSMIKTVTMDASTYTDIPFRFEAGTPDVSGAISLGAAIDFILSIGIESIQHHENDLYDYALSQLVAMDRVRILGSSSYRTGAISLVFDQAHPSDVGEILDKQGIAVRTGHHCCQPIMDFYHTPGTLRASFAVYNRKSDVDSLVAGISKALTLL